MKFRIQTHGRLQEWVAEEKGYFADEGLDYVFVDNSLLNHELVSGDRERQSGAFEVMEEGNTCAVGSACHWAVNAAASASNGKMWGHAYSVTPSGIYVRNDSPRSKPEDLAGVPIAVGYHSGSHFSALGALQQVLHDDAIDLSYRGGPQNRLRAILDGIVEAANIFGAPMYVLEQLGYRRLVDTTFMIGFLIENDAPVDDVRAYFRALKRAQADIDAEPWYFKHYFLKELPREYHEMVDVAAFGPGERIVFEPYTRQLFESTQTWMRENELFPDGVVGAVRYEAAVV